MSYCRIDVVAVVEGQPAGWAVELRHRDTAIAGHAMRALGKYPAPAQGGLATAEAITQTLEALRNDTAAVDDVHALGEHLYASLLAPAWPELEPVLARFTLVEIALALAHDDTAVLAALPWELMRANGGFLAAGLVIGGRLVDIAITRRVPRRAAIYPGLVQPLRYLFALGTELGDEVRAGAESLGLLRQIAPAVRDRIVQRQSLDALSREVTAFDPHVVHLICHGRDVGFGGVELEMWNDDTGSAEYVNAMELTDRLVRPHELGIERAPTLVILSTCSSGQRLQAATSTDIATALVMRGVPMVVGMSAEIRDLACRLFTRRLGTAIVDRTPLLAAAVAGRRAALRSAQLSVDSFDWGMIQLVIGTDVDAMLGVQTCQPDSDEDKVLRWLRSSGLPIDLDPRTRRHPPLCGATEVIEGFAELMSSQTLAALVLHARPPKPEGSRWREGNGLEAGSGESLFTKRREAPSETLRRHH